MKKKICIILIILAILSFSLVACGKEETIKKYVSAPSINRADSVKTDATADLDESGLFSKINGIGDIEFGASVPEFYSSLEGYSYPDKGVRIQAVSSGAQVYYTKVVDLNKVEGDLIQFEAEYNDNSSIDSMTIEVVDIYDATRKFSVNWFVLSYEMVSNILVNCGSVSSACSNESAEWLGIPRVQYGAVSYISNFRESILDWYGNKHEHSPFSFKFDVATNRITADIGDVYKDFLLLDIDDPVQMGGDSECFEGFTTGEVYIKITFSGVNGNGAIVVSSLGGDDLTSENLKAVPSNYIKLLTPHAEYRKELPNGKVGTYYTIPVADGEDLICGKFEISAMTESPSGKTKILSENGFTPDEVGVYKLVYYAKDINGFSVVRSCEIDVRSAIPEIVFTPSVTESQQLPVLSECKMPYVNVDGGSGVVELTEEYFFNGEPIFADELGNYRFDKSGTLKYTVKACDYLGFKSEDSYEYTVAGGDYIKLRYPVPIGLSANSSYSLPDFEIVSESDAQYEKSITVNGELVGADGKITVPASGSVDVVFYGNKGEASEIKKEVSAQVVTGISDKNVSGMFINQNASVVQDNSGIQFSATEEDNKIQFANPLSANYAELYFAPTDKNSYDYLEITLTDAFNQDNSVSFRVFHDNYLYDNFRMKNKDGNYDTLVYKVSSLVTASERFHLFYENTTRKIYNANYKDIATLRFCDNGNVFRGFDGSALFVSAKIGAISGEAQVALQQLGNQQFNVNGLSFGDIIAPQIAFQGVLATGSYPIGTKLTLPVAKAIDVLNTFSKINVSLTAPDGEKLLNAAPCFEAKTFIFDEQGVYIIKYSLEDGEGRKTTVEYSINIIDLVPPTVSAEGLFNEKYFVGDSITLVTANVADDVDATDKLTVKVMIVDPNCGRTVKSVGDIYQVTCVGNYRIIYCVWDVAGNYAESEVKVVVTEKEAK